MSRILPKELVKAVNENNLILFIGAGCSIPLKFPSWKALIVEILNNLNEIHGDTEIINFKRLSLNVEAGTTSLFDALNIIENNTKTKEQYKIESKQLINNIFNEKMNLISESKIHSLLWEVSNKIITTNYDNVLDVFIPSNKNIIVFGNDNKFQSLKSQENDSNFLYKIHGNYQNPETLILFNSDYESIYNHDNHNWDTLASLFKDKTFLFIGFSLSDPFVNKLFDSIKKIYGGFSVNKHFAFSTIDNDFSRYDVHNIKVENWEDCLISYLEELVKIQTKSKIDYLNNGELKIDAINEDKDFDLNSLNTLVKRKIEELKKNPSDTALVSEINDLRNKINKLLFEDIDYLQKIDLNYKKSDLRSLFDQIYSSEKLDKSVIERINNIRSDINNYTWYDRSVVLSSITCSLIHFNKADEKKINLIIDFINDNEEKVWQKAITSLFMVLNHLGSKWLRYSQITKKIENLKQIPKIQDACFQITQLFNIGYHNVSFVGKRIFDNEYFKDSPFNYFLPFFEDENNIGFNEIYENFEGNDIREFINFLHEIPFPDQLKYLICNSKAFSGKSDKEGKIEIEKRKIDIINITYSFYPFSVYIHELINFYVFFPKLQHENKLRYQLQITETPLVKYLLNDFEKSKALAAYFMKQKQWGQAIVNCKNADAISPNNVNVLLNLANCYHFNKDESNELLIRQQIYKIDVEIEDNLKGLHSIYFKRANYNKCIELSNLIIKINENDADNYIVRAQTYDELEKYNEAIIDFEKAISLDGTNAKYYYWCANVYLYTNKFDKAEEFLVLAENLGHNKSDIYNMYANLYRLKNNIEKAFEFIEKAIKIDDDPILIGTKAVIYATNGNDLEFYKSLEDVLKKGIDAKRLFPDIKKKYKDDEKFNQILKKYNQAI